jgi:hypothetical protein
MTNSLPNNPDNNIHIQSFGFQNELKNLSRKDGLLNGYLVATKNGDLKRINIFQYISEKLSGHLPSNRDLKNAVRSYVRNHKSDVKTTQDVAMLSNLMKNAGLSANKQDNLEINDLYWQVTPHYAEGLKKEYEQKNEPILKQPITSSTTSKNVENENNLRELFLVLKDEDIPDIRDGFLYSRTENPIKYAKKEISGETIIFFQGKKASEKGEMENFDIRFNLNTKSTAKNGKEVMLSSDELEIIKKTLSSDAHPVINNPEKYEIFNKIEKLNIQKKTPNQTFIIKDQEAMTSQLVNGWAEKGNEIRFNPTTREIYKNNKKIDSLDGIDLVLFNETLNQAQKNS